MNTPYRQQATRRTTPCPSCRSALLEPVYFDNVEVDACCRCGGLYFDGGELAQIIQKELGSLPENQTMGPPHGPTQVVCVACHQPMHLHSLGDEGLWVHACQRCHGIWLAAGQLDLIKQSHVTELIEKDTTWKTWLFQFLLALPVEFNLKAKRFPFVTYALLVLNLLAFGSLVFGPADTIVQGYALYPALVGEPQWWVSLLSYQFLHGGYLHIGMNLYFLYILGDNVEDAMGWLGFIGFYLICGVAGGVAHTLIDSGGTTPMVGASGAISGVMAAYAVFFRRAKLTFMLLIFQFKVSAVAYMGIWLVLNIGGLVLGGQGVAWGAHLGGFGLGLVLALALDGVVLARRPLVRLLRNHQGKKLAMR